MIKKIGLISLSVSDIEKSKAFFKDTLGMHMSTYAPEYGWAEFTSSEGECLLGIGQPQQEEEMLHKPGTNGIPSLEVADVVTTKAALEKKGVTFLSDIIEVPGHVKMVLFADPDGNKFFLTEQLS